MTETEAKKNLDRWKRWAKRTQKRWPEGSPLSDLARRYCLIAESKALEAKAIKAAAERHHSA